jgi:hypothetical protein
MSSPARTTQTITGSRSVPSDRTEAIRISCAAPIRSSSWLVHVGMTSMQPVIARARESLSFRVLSKPLSSHRRIGLLERYSPARE